MATDATYRFGFDMGPLLAAQARAPQVTAEELERFFGWTLTLLTGEIQDRTPADAGHLRNSIIGQTQVTEGGAGILGVIGTPLAYAPAVELGAKPHPVSEAGILALAEWAKRKLPLGQAVSIKTGKPLKNDGVEAAALSAAHAIAWKIRHRGSKGAFMFRDAFTANRVRVQARFEEAIQRINERIGGGQ